MIGTCISRMRCMGVDRAAEQSNVIGQYVGHFPPILLLSLFVSALHADPVANGNTISWTDEGWHQVMSKPDFRSLCEGGSSCTVQPGTYLVVNHLTGERFDDICVANTSSDAPTLALLLSTGQVESFFSGDDGDYQSGTQTSMPRYVANGDGTFTDSLTQLIWIANSDCIPTSNWVGALEFANQLSADGSSSCTALTDGSVAGDWRLANIRELQSLYDYGANLAIEGVPLTDLSVGFDDFWSSTSFESAPTPNDIGIAWEIQFGSTPNTGSHLEQKSSMGRAWAVRDSR